LLGGQTACHHIYNDDVQSLFEEMALH
jgi:hypothetical protein